MRRSDSSQLRRVGRIATYSEGRLFGQRSSRIGGLLSLLSLLGMGIAQQRGRGDQCGGEGRVEAHGDGGSS